MSQPAAYPSTDTPEQEAIATLLNLLHHNLIKADLKSRDKQPNTDGTLEIVDDNRRPIGKLDVQVRKIPVSHQYYDCESSLVGYSKVTNNPFVLICVDTKKKIAFWKHLSSSMPEYKESQKYFRIHFIDPTDTIDMQGHYVARWIDITKEYQNRLAEYPLLRNQISNELFVSTVSKEDRILAQDYIDSVNYLLDNELSGFKALLFPNVWKLGFAFLYSDSDRIKYQIFRIPKGSPAPLVIKQKDTPLFEPVFSRNSLFESSVPRNFISDPQKAGRKFVFERVQALVIERGLPIFGRQLSEDVIVGFIDEYSRLLALQPYQAQYSLAAIHFGMEEYLFDLCARFIWTKLKKSDFVKPFDLDSLQLFFGKIDPKTLKMPPQPIRFSLTSKNVPIKAAYTALDYLIAQGIDQVGRNFANPDYKTSDKGNWIWSGYSYEDEIKSVRYILENCVGQYSEFVMGNRFGFINSPYLDNETAIIFVYESSHSSEIAIGPILTEYQLKNGFTKLPKVTVLFKDDVGTTDYIDSSKFPDIIYRGEHYTARKAPSGTASFFFMSTPFLRMIYRMLIYDLQDAFGFEHFRAFIY